MQARSLSLDILRTAALILMIIYHFCYDLWLFGWNLDPFSSPLITLARTSLILFLLVSGASFAEREKRGWETLQQKLKWIMKRTGILLGAALLVSIVTWYASPQEFVRFGVLHLIAASTLLLALIPSGSVINIVIGFLSIALASFLPSVSQNPVLLPFGIPPPNFMTIDYVPILPWFGVIVLGRALWPLVPVRLLVNKIYSRRTLTLTWAGRHSLIVYLVHQPVVIGILYLMKK